jgi:hypothetical protein
VVLKKEEKRGLDFRIEKQNYGFRITKGMRVFFSKGLG